MTTEHERSEALSILAWTRVPGITSSSDAVSAVTRILAERNQLRTENARLRAALAAAPRWVSVAEGLPGPRKDDDDLLALRENGFRVEAMYDGSSWWEFDHELQDWIPLAGVTHWYQVPRAPEVKP